MNLCPFPRSVRRLGGSFVLPDAAGLRLDPRLPRETVLLPIARRLSDAARRAGVRLGLVTGAAGRSAPAIQAVQSLSAPRQGEGYVLRVEAKGILLHYRDEGGLRAAVATLRQLLAEFGRHLPRLVIRDYPDFPRRGVMLDVSRGRVPNLQTLLELAEDLADFKINELQLYTEHTFAYRDFEPVWRDWGALTGAEILELDAHCRQLGIDLAPNQNSFGHLRQWLEYPPLKGLAETPKPYEDGNGAFLRYPSTLAPNHPGALRFLTRLYDELLPCFTSAQFNVGCDETWDLGRGRSRALCERKGKGRVYLDFLKRIHREVAARGKRMMFWGDIILHYPDLIGELPKDIIALNWGYEADHPFDRETALFARSGIPFYVCPGTSTWMTLIGRHDNALANLRSAARAGAANGAAGYLITDWGDGGHPQPLAVSYLPYLAGAALSWCAKTFEERLMVPVLDRDIFRDLAGRTARAVMALGMAHRKFGIYTPNSTPFGTVIAAPPPERREIFCRDGLKLYERISGRRIRAALAEVEARRERLSSAKPEAGRGRVLARELDFAAWMAALSCSFMLWQQSRVSGSAGVSNRMAAKMIRDLTLLEREFRAYWPERNKGSVEKCAAFLRWRREDLSPTQTPFGA